MIFVQLIWSMLQIGLVSVGGGYAAITLIEKQIVTLHGWLTLEEFTDIITIAEMTPGPIAINCATFVGMRIGGIPGALAATFAYIVPGFIIVLVLSRLYIKYKSLDAIKHVFTGLRPMVVALVASAGVKICSLAFAGPNWVSLGIFALCLLLLRKKINPILVLLMSGAAGLLIYGI